MEIKTGASLWLDLTRVLAAQAVLIGHILSYIYPISDLQNGAVLVFFFLSGYLISMSLETKRLQKQYSFKQFLFNTTQLESPAVRPFGEGVTPKSR